MRRYPTSPPAENRDAIRKAEDRGATGAPPDQDGGPAGAPAEPDARGYGHQHSGRRAAGHGGGSLDASEDGADYMVEPGAAFSGAGRGHAFQASQQREADEEMEGRTGPYVRSGLTGRDARNQDAADPRPKEGGRPGDAAPGGRDAGREGAGDTRSRDPGSPNDPAADPDSGPPRTGGPPG